MTEQANMNQKIRIELSNTTAGHDNAVTVPDDLNVRHVVHNRRWRHHVFVDSVSIPSHEMKPVYHQSDGD